MSSEAKMRSALIACRQHIQLRNIPSWWNDGAACDLMTKHINPALGLDAWDGKWIEQEVEPKAQ